MSEKWKDILGYENIYLVSDLGRVMSRDRLDALGRKRGGRILKPRASGDGYKCVSLYLHGTCSTIYIHRMVLSAFIGPSELHCDHLNGDRSDNRLSNLEYVTARENVTRGGLSAKNPNRIGLLTGVHVEGKKFSARIKVRGKSHYLGMFDTMEEAGLAYEKELKKITGMVDQ